MNLQEKLDKMDEHLTEAFDHVRFARDLMDDEIKREAPDSCASLEKSIQRVDEAMTGIAIFLKEVASGGYETDDEELTGILSGNEMINPEQEK